MVTGYMVLAVDETGKVKSTPNDGDKVLLLCGAPCRTSSGSYDPQYQWKDSSATVIASTREHTVTAASTTSAVTYTCEILNSQCNSEVSSKSVTFTAIGWHPLLHICLCLSIIILEACPCLHAVHLPFNN